MIWLQLLTVEPNYKRPKIEKTANDSDDSDCGELVIAKDVDENGKGQVGSQDPDCYIVGTSYKGMMKMNRNSFCLDIGEFRTIMLYYTLGRDYITIIEQKQLMGNGPYIDYTYHIPLKRWKLLTKSADDIGKCLDKVVNGQDGIYYSIHLGGNNYVKVQSPYKCVQIRKWMYTKENKFVPSSKQGISLKACEWRNLIDNMEYISDNLDIESVTACADQNDHMNQQGYFACPECNPDTYKDYLV